MSAMETVQGLVANLGLDSNGRLKPGWDHGWIVLVLFLLMILAAAVVRKLATELLTLRALALTPRLSRHLSKWVKSRDYSDEEFLRADGAGARWVELRKQAIERLAGFLQTQVCEIDCVGKRDPGELFRLALY